MAQAAMSCGKGSYRRRDFTPKSIVRDSEVYSDLDAFVQVLRLTEGLSEFYGVRD